MAGLAVTLAVFVALKPVDGLHEYVAAPVAVSVVFDPAHIVASTPAFTTGNAFTATVVLVVLVQPFALVTLYVIVALPAATPVTTPVLEFTVAVAVLLELHVPPKVVLLNVVVDPIHTFEVPVFAVKLGKALIVTVAVTELVQPFAFVYV